MHKKVLIFGGGTGMSTLLKGLKEFPLDITAVVTVCDDGRSTGRLREEFGIPAVGDIRKVLVALSETEPLIAELLNYRFQTTSDLNGHTVGNLLLTALCNTTGNMSEGIESLSKVLNLKGKVLPLTEDRVTLIGKMEDDSLVEGQHFITKSPLKIKEVFYKEEIKVPPSVLRAIQDSDLIIFSMGSLYTSIIPNIISTEIKKAIDESSANLLYVCNMLTQPGETDGYKASDHVKALNSYLGKRKLNAVIVNSAHISKELVRKYETLEQKNLVKVDKKELKTVVDTVISNGYATIENNVIRHDVIKLSTDIFSYIL